MKNITITVQEETARWVRVAAAQRDLSVSKYISRLLQEQMDKEREYRQAQDRFFSRRPRGLKPSHNKYPSRKQLHER